MGIREMFHCRSSSSDKSQVLSAVILMFKRCLLFSCREQPTSVQALPQQNFLSNYNTKISRSLSIYPE